MQKKSLTKICFVLGSMAAALGVFADPPAKTMTPSQIMATTKMNDEEKIKSLSGLISEITEGAKKDVLSPLGQALLADLEAQDRYKLIEEARASLVNVNQNLAEIAVVLRSKYSSESVYPDSLDFMFRGIDELSVKNPELKYLEAAIKAHKDFIRRSTDTFLQVRKMRSP
ncbi:MAG: hypothetical protein KA116_01370 [Proteobacteria bacterium]|nr:hypothetical protein [Pseudomonadota bacterium]